jgi:hypothetical protein
MPISASATADAGKKVKRKKRDNKSGTKTKAGQAALSHFL